MQKIDYVLVTKKRGIDTEDVENQENNKPCDLIDSTIANNDKKIKKMDSVHIIDVVSSQYAEESSKNANTLNQNLDKEKNVEQLNGEVIIEEKDESKKTDTTKPDYVYDIYYTKNNDIHLDIINLNNLEIKSYNYYEEAELVDDASDPEPEGIAH